MKGKVCMITGASSGIGKATALGLARMNACVVTANALHPGAVATDAMSKDPDLPAFNRFMVKLFNSFFMSPEKGAQTSIYLASSEEVAGVTGHYFIKNKSVRSSPESYDEAIAQRLWEVSLELNGQID